MNCLMIDVEEEILARESIEDLVRDREPQKQAVAVVCMLASWEKMKVF